MVMQRLASCQDGAYAGGMTKRTKIVGYQTGKSSDAWMSPRKPYTGDGKTRRSIFSGVLLKFTEGGKKGKTGK